MQDTREAMEICHSWHDIFIINNKYYLLIVDYHSKFLAVKQVEGFSADNLMKNVRLSF